MPEKDYSHRSTVQKLGLKIDERLEITGDVGSGLRSDAKVAVGRGLVVRAAAALDALGRRGAGPGLRAADLLGVQHHRAQHL